MVRRKLFRRRRYLVEAFQFKYVGLILFLMFFVAVVSSYTTYFTSITLLGEKLASVYPQGRLVVILKKVNSILILRLSLLIPIIIGVSIWFSHKIAGPVYRMKQYLRQIAEGDFSTRITLRKRDELADLAESINYLTTCLSGVTGDNITDVENIRNEFAILKGEMNSGAIDSAKARLDNLQRQVDSVSGRLLKCKVQPIAKQGL